MKRIPCFDRLFGWFVLNVVAAILVSVLMSLAFMQFAGVWANPSLESSGLIHQVTGLVMAIDATPADERSPLARKMASPTFKTHWYRQWEQLPKVLRDQKIEKHDHSPLSPIAELLHRPNIAILAVNSDDPEYRPASGMRFYAIAIQLTDGSWVSFTTRTRSWGMDRRPKIALTVLCILLAIGIVGSVASRRLARPMEQLARASERFGFGSRATPLQLDGPREIREAASAFNAMQERIQQLMDSRTAMLMAISHDLHAPLTRMRLRSEFVEDPEQQQKQFRDVDEMRAMIEASLTFFRLDGQQEEVTALDLGELLHTVVDDFQDMRAAVEWVEPAQRVVYSGRPLALRRAVTNLIDNAVKYGVSATVTLHQEVDRIVMTIDDNGPGVPPSLIPKLFEPFFRGEPSRNRATGGFGLGLASALLIVRSHHGELVLENRQPHGLRVAVILPRLAGFS